MLALFCTRSTFYMVNFIIDMLTVRKGYPARVYIDWTNIDQLELDKLKPKIVFCNEFGKVTSRTMALSKPYTQTKSKTNEMVNTSNLPARIGVTHKNRDSAMMN